MKRVKLKVLEKFFEETELSDEPIRFDQCSVITDQKKFVDSHLSILRANSGNKSAMPYYDRLLKYYYLIKNQNDYGNRAKRTGN